MSVDIPSIITDLEAQIASSAAKLSEAELGISIMEGAGEDVTDEKKELKKTKTNLMLWKTSLETHKAKFRG